MAKWPICDICGEEHDGGGCDGCDRDVCPDCMARFPDNKIYHRYVAACKICAADPDKLRELAEHLTPEFVAHLERLGNDPTYQAGYWVSFDTMLAAAPSL